MKDNVRRTLIRHDSAEIPLPESETGYETEDEISILKAEIDKLNSVIQLLNHRKQRIAGEIKIV